MDLEREMEKDLKNAVEYGKTVDKFLGSVFGDIFSDKKREREDGILCDSQSK